jgi:hypothetical protein
LRELFDAYAHCADRRDAEGQKALFTEDTRFAVYMDGEGSEPTYVLQGREALTPVFEDLNRYEATTISTAKARSPSTGIAPRARATRTDAAARRACAVVGWCKRTRSDSRKARLSRDGRPNRN